MFCPFPQKKNNISIHNFHEFSLELFFYQESQHQDEWFSFFVQMFWTAKLKFLWELCHGFPGSILSKLQKYFVAQRQMFIFDI